jgi:hypothetical protein
MVSVLEKVRMTIAMMPVARQGRMILSLLQRSSIFPAKEQPNIRIMAMVVRKSPGFAIL